MVETQAEKYKTIVERVKLEAPLDYDAFTFFTRNEPILRGVSLALYGKQSQAVMSHFSPRIDELKTHYSNPILQRIDHIREPNVRFLKPTPNAQLAVEYATNEIRGEKVKPLEDSQWAHLVQQYGDYDSNIIQSIASEIVDGQGYAAVKRAQADITNYVHQKKGVPNKKLATSPQVIEKKPFVDVVRVLKTDQGETYQAVCRKAAQGIMQRAEDVLKEHNISDVNATFLTIFATLKQFEMNAMRSMQEDKPAGTGSIVNFPRGR